MKVNRPSQYIEAHTKPGRHAYDPKDAKQACEYILELEARVAELSSDLNTLQEEAVASVKVMSDAGLLNNSGYGTDENGIYQTANDGTRYDGSIEYVTMSAIETAARLKKWYDRCSKDYANASFDVDELEGLLVIAVNLLSTCNLQDTDPEWDERRREFLSLLKKKDIEIDHER